MFLKTKNGFKKGRPVSYEDDIILFRTESGNECYAHVNRLVDNYEITKNVNKN